MHHQLGRRKLLRDVNERIREINAGFGVATASYELLCEYGRSDCSYPRIEVPAFVFEEARTYEDRFLVAVGHERSAHDRIDAKNGSHLVVSASSPLSDAAEPQATDRRAT